MRRECTNCDLRSVIMPYIIQLYSQTMSFQMMGLKQKLLKSYKFMIEPKKCANTISPKISVAHTFRTDVDEEQATYSR